MEPLTAVEKVEGTMLVCKHATGTSHPQAPPALQYPALMAMSWPGMKVPTFGHTIWPVGDGAPHSSGKSGGHHAYINLCVLDQTKERTQPNNVIQQ